MAALQRQPITACLIGMLLTVPLSHLRYIRIEDAIGSGIVFVKLIIYYLLLVANLHTVARFRQFLLCLVLATMVLISLGMLQYYAIIDIPALTNLQEGFDRVADEATGEAIVLPRLCSAGIFNNPNDLARIIAVSMFLCMYWLVDRTAGMLRFLWIVPLGVMGWALAMTFLRGGFIGFIAGVGLLIYSRFGAVKTALLGGMVLPVLLVGFQGRQTNFTLENDTGQQRIQLWREGFQALRAHPFFGIGMEQYADEVGHGLGAHNTFVQCYVELGVLGGSCFAGACALGLWLPIRLGGMASAVHDVQLLAIRPFVLALTGSYVVGMWSSHRAYSPATYALLGLSASYLNLTAAYIPLSQLRNGKRFLPWLAAVGIGLIVFIDIFIRIFAV